MKRKFELTIEQLELILELVKQNNGIDVDLLLKAMGVNEKVAFEGIESGLDLEEVVPIKSKVKKRSWSDEDKDKLIYLYENTSFSTREIGLQLGVKRTMQAVTAQINILRNEGKIKTYRTSQGGIVGRRWTDKEDKIIENLIEDHKEPRFVPKILIKNLTKLFNRTENSINTRLYKIYRDIQEKYHIRGD